MWQDLLGSDAPDGAAEQLAESWRVLPWPFLRRAVRHSNATARRKSDKESRQQRR
jgi:hypothetical protein